MKRLIDRFQKGVCMFYYDWTMLLVIPGLLLGLWAQFRVQSTFSKYGSVLSSNGQSADRVARLLLNHAGCDAVDIEQTSGSLTDHYDPRTNVLRLSSSVVGSTSVAAIGVAAHECGHAIQDKENYTFMKIRSSLVPVVNLVSYAGYFAMIISIFMGAMQYLMVGILMELATVVFQLVTLPVEFDASKRALKEIEELNLVSKEELDGAKKVLSAAAFTYVASALAAILQRLRLLIMYGNRNND